MTEMLFRFLFAKSFFPNRYLKSHTLFCTFHEKGDDKDGGDDDDGDLSDFGEF